MARNEVQDILVTCAEEVLPHLHQEFPTWNSNRLVSRGDLSTPRERHPLFFGSYDWHSCVHSHWALLRVATIVPNEQLAQRVYDAFAVSLNEQDIAAECEAWRLDNGFEMPYGATWFLRLMSALHLAGDRWRVWRDALSELEAIISSQVWQWLDNINLPDRNGQHFNTAASMVRVLQWSDTRGLRSFRDRAESVARSIYFDDVDAPFRYEPTAASFLSPLLAEADLMGRCLDRPAFTKWLERFTPSWFVEGPKIQIPPSPTSPDNFFDAHLAALPFTNAAALTSIGNSLGDTDLSDGLRTIAARQVAQGLEHLDTSRYSVGHWVNSYVVDALT